MAYRCSPLDYRICRRCKLGWIESPYTPPRYQRCGLASAAWPRCDVSILCCRGTPWAATSAHHARSELGWAPVQDGYQQRPMCPRVNSWAGV
jgi:hypothetical protein